MHTGVHLSDGFNEKSVACATLMRTNQHSLLRKKTHTVYNFF